MDQLANIDLLAMSSSLLALILGTAIGWLVARWRFSTTIAQLNTNLVLERRVNKQLSRTLEVDAVPNLIQAPNLTTAVQTTREPTTVSG